MALGTAFVSVSYICISRIIIDCCRPQIEHPCENAWKPFLSGEHKAPFIWIREWSNLVETLHMYEVMSDSELDRLQASVLQWYHDFMKHRVSIIEAVLASRSKV